MNEPRKHKSKIRKRLESSGDKIRRARLPKKMKIAAKIHRVLEEMDYTNKSLASGLDKYSSEITKWLKGDHNFTVDTLSDIEEVLNIKLLAIDDDSENSNVANSLKLTLKVEYCGNQKDYEKAMAEIYEAGGKQATGYKLEHTSQ